MTKISQSLYILSISPWPIILSMSILSSAITFISMIHSKLNIYMFILIILMILMPSLLWWRDEIRESTYQGNHSNNMMNLLKKSMIMFITSEIMFFLSFFWAYFHCEISPNIEIGNSWPPIGIKTFNPFSIPLLNSIILLSSGSTVTLAHHLFLNKNISKSFYMINFTILLGMVFSMFQWIEYNNSSFNISDSIYSSTFFITTGFHGIHVIIGSMMLMSNSIRLYNFHMSKNHAINLDLAIWYWHFVDVVWLFLFISIYWYGK
uniref:Cytochrome c oxidase subunit 3 n=1 Tax=Pyemotes zhonghuajia TaxID=2749944 RepID=A0A8T9JCX5_9ACAR|nr:cytochrome c oxidase subunit III [Pyemotes zhonghuajia]UOK09671.1 cytochrome c oxidase subunit 3 [Pyemotes zhonghuajia]